MTLKPRTWGSLLLVASGVAAFAANDLFNDPAPAVQVQGVVPIGQQAVPPPFSWNDIFKGAQ